jgi:hypothetical protein
MQQINDEQKWQMRSMREMCALCHMVQRKGGDNVLQECGGGRQCVLQRLQTRTNDENHYNQIKGFFLIA